MSADGQGAWHGYVRRMGEQEHMHQVLTMTIQREKSKKTIVNMYDHHQEGRESEWRRRMLRIGGVAQSDPRGYPLMIRLAHVSKVSN